MILAAVLLAVAVGAWAPPADGAWRAHGGSTLAGGPGGVGATHGERTARSVIERLWRRMRGQRDSHDGEELLVLLDAIAPALAAGLPPAAALAHLTRRGQDVTGAGDHRVGPVEALLADLVAEARGGRPLAPVWTRHAREGRWGSPGPGRGGRRGASGRPGWSAEVAFVARAWSLSESLGSPLAECASVAARAVRQRSARRQRLAVALAGPRATATVLTSLPLAGPLVGLLLGLSPGQLYATPPAVVSTVSGLALLLLGRWWCARLVGSIGRRRATGSPRASPRARLPGRGAR